MTAPTTSRLDGKVCLVTGAARGIGEGIARRFVAEGGVVFATDRDAAGGRAAADACGASFRELDVREDAHWQAVVDAILEQHGQLDVVVNNAGITGFDDGLGPFDPEHVSLDDWRSVFATNVEGVMLGCKHAIRAMRPHGNGSIVNIGSRSGLVGVPAASAYAASKAAVTNHTRSVALWCASQRMRIRCNVIQPAAVLTPMWEPMLGDGPDRAVRMADCVRDTPLRRFGTVEEVASLAVYLASDESGYATGSEFHLDGGILAGGVTSPPVEDDS